MRSAERPHAEGTERAWSGRELLTANRTSHARAKKNGPVELGAERAGAQAACAALAAVSSVSESRSRISSAAWARFSNARTTSGSNWDPAFSHR